MKIKPIIIYAPPFSRMRGGFVVLHKLCHLLNRYGFESYLAPIWFDNGWFWYGYDHTPLASSIILEQDFVAVYSEGIVGNPLNAKYVVRWILGVDESARHTYGKDDIIYWFDDIYYSDILGQKNNKLYVVETNKHIFHDKKYERSGSCYAVRKNDTAKLVHPLDSLSINWEMSQNQEMLSNIFNITEKFYCYDAHTFLHIMATMCGCVSILPIEDNTIQEKYRDHKLNKIIAFGENDIPRAKEARSSVMKYLETIDEEIAVDVIKFGVMCNNL